MNKLILLLSLTLVTTSWAQERYSIKNLSVNTKYSDFGFSYYGDYMGVYSSTKPGRGKNAKWKNNQPFLELYQAGIQADGEIIGSRLFSDKINTEFHESNVALSKNLRTMYFTRNNYFKGLYGEDARGVNNLKIYIANLAPDGYVEYVGEFPLNNDQYSVGHPALSPDETKLYFISNMPGGYGKTDIYVVDLLPNGKFGEPRNLGPNINTDEKEMFPFVSEDGVLYFSSAGHGSYGGLDIFASKIKNDKYSDPLNLERPLNSEGDDFTFVKKGLEPRGYFSSNRNGGKGDDDIYFYEELVPIEFPCRQWVFGDVREKATGTLLPNTQVFLYEDEEVVEAVTSNALARFEFPLDCQKTYSVKAEKENYTSEEQMFSTDDENKKETLVSLELKSDEFVVDRGRVLIKINTIYFDLNKSHIRSDASKELDKVYDVMQKYPNIKIEIGSHTDSRGDDEYNMDLSNRRAASTMGYILAKGIGWGRIRGGGKGESELVNNCGNGVRCSEKEHSLNRRTEFVVTFDEETIPEKLMSRKEIKALERSTITPEETLDENSMENDMQPAASIEPEVSDFYEEESQVNNDVPEVGLEEVVDNSYNENYSDDDTFTRDEVEIQYEVEEIPFARVEEVPVFPGCDKLEKWNQKECFVERVRKHINKKFNPSLASNLGLSPGKERINVICTISEEGRVIAVKARGSHTKLEKEAIRVVKSLPQMVPGKSNGRVVKVLYPVSIVFLIK